MELGTHPLLTGSPAIADAERPPIAPLARQDAWPPQAAVVRAVTALMFLEHFGVVDHTEYLDIRGRIYRRDVEACPKEAASARAVQNVAARWAKR